jgi:hemerythrin
MQNTLVTWLMNHIKREDMDYSAAVVANMGADKLKEAEAANHSGWLGGALRRFFGGK